jgi:hypothetical protein
MHRRVVYHRVAGLGCFTCPRSCCLHARTSDGHGDRSSDTVLAPLILPVFTPPLRLRSRWVGGGAVRYGPRGSAVNHSTVNTQPTHHYGLPFPSRYQPASLDCCCCFAAPPLQNHPARRQHRPARPNDSRTTNQPRYLPRHTPSDPPTSVTAHIPVPVSSYPSRPPRKITGESAARSWKPSRFHSVRTAAAPNPRKGISSWPRIYRGLEWTRRTVLPPP